MSSSASSAGGSGGAASAAGVVGSVGGPTSDATASASPNPYPSLSVLRSPSAALPPLVPPSSSYTSSTARGVMFSDSRKRRKRHADRVLPERVELDVPESALFRSLLALERRLDAAIARRYVELQEALYTPQHLYQTVRVYVWHEWQHLPTGQYWTLRLLCCWVDDADGSLGAGSGAATSPLRVLGNIFQSVTVQLDPVLYPEPADGCIEWRKQRTAALTDGFELHRKEWTVSGRGAAACGVKIFLVPDYSPPLFTLSTALSRIVGLRQASHPYVLRSIWRYCTERSLLSSTDASIILPDDALSALMDSHQPATLQQINHRIQQQPHMTPAEPIQLQHFITPPTAVSSSSTAAESASVYDITLPLPEMPSIANVGTQMQTTFAAFAVNAATDTDNTTHTGNTAPHDDSNIAAATAAAAAGSTTATTITTSATSTGAAAANNNTATAATPAASASAVSQLQSSSLSSPLSAVPPSLSKEWKDLSALSDSLTAQLTEMHRIAARRQFLHAFAACPVDTINLLIAQQARHAMLALTTHRAEQAEQAVRREQADLAAAAIAAGGAAAAGSSAHLHLAGSRSVALLGGEEEKARRGRYYSAEWMQDAVDRYLEYAKQASTTGSNSSSSSSRQQMVDA